jgi:hypothetical protein
MFDATVIKLLTSTTSYFTVSHQLVNSPTWCKTTQVAEVIQFQFLFSSENIVINPSLSQILCLNSKGSDNVSSS